MLFCAVCVTGYASAAMLGIGLATHSMCMLGGAVLCALTTMRLTYY